VNEPDEAEVVSILVVLPPVLERCSELAERLAVLLLSG
jgi:hypothetical protein